MPADAAMLDDMTQTAYGLGKAFGAMALEAADRDAKIRFAELFDRCFASVRLAIALKLRLRRMALVADREPASDHEAVERDEGLEAERPERLEYTERDRDREAERPSFPLLLKTLNGVVASAEALPGPEPAELPTLRELLARVGAPPQARPPTAALKARLSGSTAPAVTVLERPAKPASRPALPLRRATGPPKR